MRTIRSRDNPLLKQLTKLSGSSRERRQSGTTILDGEHLIEAYYQAAIGPVELIAASETGMQRTSVASLMERACASSRVVIEDKLLLQVSQVVSPSGILAVIKTPRASDLPPTIESGLILEGIQDPGNLGSIFRTALGAGVRNIYLSDGSVFAWSPKVIRAGMGAHFHLSIYENLNLPLLAQRAATRIIATQAKAARTIYEEDLRTPTIWMFGNEGAGLSQSARDLASTSVSVPMAGYTESLNVAAAVAVCLFEQSRQRRAG